MSTVLLPVPAVPPRRTTPPARARIPLGGLAAAGPGVMLRRVLRPAVGGGDVPVAAFSSSI